MDPFREAIERNHQDISEETFEKFERYGALILKWNRNINLISRQDEDRIKTRHFLESAGLALAVDFGKNQYVLDLGSGAGFPGIPLKIMRPDLKLILVESRKKKALFLREAVECLHLDNVEIIPDRVEDFAPGLTCHSVVSRAVGDLSLLFKWSRHLLLNPGGQIIAMKGPRIHEEASTFRKIHPEIRCEVKEYNPYPEHYPLQDHYLGILTL